MYGKEGDTLTPLLPKTSATQVTINDSDGNESTVNAEIIKLRQAVVDAVSKGVHFKGVVTSTSSLPSVAYEAGWMYAVKEAGTYAGQTCEVGDLIICVNDYASGSASNSDWNVLQVNIVGAVTGPDKSVALHVAVFDGTSGKIIADSGYTIGKSVPSDAKFSDTTYSEATASAAGLLSATLYSKLLAIEAGADKTDTDNVSAAGAFMKATNTTDDLKEGTKTVVMTTDERTKLAGLAEGAEKNQNAYSTVKVGSTSITAGSTTDTLEVAAGDGITLTPDATNKKLTVAETYIDCAVVTSLDNTPSNLRNGGIVWLKS